MKCTEFRDLAELMHDGALDPGEAASARAHIEGCASCRAFEEECTVLVTPFSGFPPGPYHPPEPPGRLPPWATGSTLGALLALVLAGAGAAWALLGAGRRVSPVPDGKETVSAPRVERPAAPFAETAAEPPAPGIVAAEGGVTLLGRVVFFPGWKPVAGAKIRIDGVLSATTDAAGVFRVRDLAPAGSRLLRLEPPGGPSSETLLPYLEPGQVHSLADLLVGPPGSATVRVIERDSRPAAGVVVRACRLAPTIHPDTQPNWMPGTRGAILPGFLSRPADGSGVAEFPSLAPGLWTFQAEREGIPFSQPVDLEIRDDPDAAVEILLDPATVLQGRVLDDSTGAPVAGALVRWARVGMKSSYDDFRRQGAATTGPDGGFRFPAAPAVPLLLDVRPPGAPCRTGGMCVDAARVDRADLRLPATRVLSGVCVEAETGLPAAGVLLRIGSRISTGMVPIVESLYTRSGPDGRFEVRGLAETAVLQVGVQPWTTWCEKNREDLPVLAGTPCRLEVRRSWSIGGVVRNAAGQPASGRVVAAYQVLRRMEGFSGWVSPVGRTVADGEGRFLLEHLPPGPAAVYSPSQEDLRSAKLMEEARTALESPESPSFVVEGRAAAGPPLEIPARVPDPSSAVTMLDDGVRTIRGQVLDAAGAPVPGVSLFLQRGDLSPFLRNRGSAPLLMIPMGTDLPVAPDGSFLARIPPYESQGGRMADAFTLVAYSPLHPPAVAAARLEGKDGVEGVVVRFEEGFAVTGRILREDGAPAAGALLEAVAQQDARPNGNSLMVRARAAEDGSFRIEGLPAGPHTLVVGRDPGPVHRVAGLVPGGDPVEIRLPEGDGVRPELPRTYPWRGPQPDPARTAALGGRLLGVPQRLVSIVVVDPTSREGSVFWATTDESGRFSCSVPQGRRFSVAAKLGEGRWLYTDDIPSGSTDTVLRTDGPSTGFLRGRVVTPAGAPASSVPIHAVRRGEKGEPDFPATVLLDGREWSNLGSSHTPLPRWVRTTLTGSDGSFDLGSPSGRWAVFAGLPGSGELAPGPAVPWSSGDPQSLEVSLSPGRVLQARAAEDDAPPHAAAPEWAEIRLDGFLPGAEGPVLAVRLLPRPGGLFEFRGLPPGRATVLLLDANRKEMGRGSAEPGDPRDPPVEIPVKR